MTRIAVSGHRGLPEPTVQLIKVALQAELVHHVPDLVGITCLADGADQLFAQVVIDLGGALEVVVPAQKYRDALPDAHKPLYDQLLARAANVRERAFVESDSQAHMAASVDMLIDADLLVAVWDGQPARGFGGTADVVNHARQQNIPVLVIWPEGCTRE